MSDVHIIQHGSIPAQKTTQLIKVEGDIRIRLVVLSIIGAMLIIITVGGITGLILNESSFGKYWQGLLTIISGSIFGLVGFIIGRKVSGDD